MLRPLYRDHLFLVLVQAGVFSLMAAMLYYLGVFEDPYFSWGPREGLNFMGVAIDTFERWGWMIAVRIVCAGTQAVVGTVVGPWITTVFQNESVAIEDMGYSLTKARMILNIYEITNILNGVISIFLMFVQADIALIEGATIMFVLNTWTVNMWIGGKEEFKRKILATKRTVEDTKRAFEIPVYSELKPMKSEPDQPRTQGSGTNTTVRAVLDPIEEESELAMLIYDE